MQGEALSDVDPGAKRRSWLPLALVLGLVALYFGVTSGVRWYVSEQIASTVGRPLPDFALPDRSGRVWKPADLRGKTTLLNFFRSQCPGCLREKNALRTLAAEGVQVISVMMDEVEGYPTAVTAATLRTFGYEHPVLMADRAFVEAFHGAGWAHVTPVTYIVDAKGMITASLRGHQDLETLRAASR